MTTGYVCIDNGITHEDYFQVAGKKQGPHRFYYPSGWIVTHYVDDKREGACHEYYNTGQLCAVYHYANDKKEGACYEYYITGELHREYHYRSDVKMGVFKQYALSGQLVLHCYYHNNDLVANSNISDDGELYTTNYYRYR